MSIFRDAQFNLRKWSAMESFRIVNKQILKLDENPEVTRLLGLKWRSVTESFKFQVMQDKLDNHTKRNLLSDGRSIFDPLRWLSPVTIRIKILFQQLCLHKLGWDDELPHNIFTKWLLMRDDLMQRNHVNIPRWLQNTKELNLYCDSSK